MCTSRRRVAAALAALFLLHTLISFHGLREVFLRGHQGFAGSLRASMGRNYVRHGLDETGVRPYRHHVPREDLEGARIHWHHPPGLGLMVGASFAAFGVSEAATRLVPILASLASFLLLFVIVRRRYGEGVALGAVAIFALLPMQIEYGNHVSYGVPITTLLLLASLTCSSARARGGLPERRKWYGLGQSWRRDRLLRWAVLTALAWGVISDESSRILVFGLSSTR